MSGKTMTSVSLARISTGNNTMDKETDDELTRKLIGALDDLHSAIEMGQVELDRDAKRALYGNIRRLYRRSDSAEGNERG